MTTPDPTVPFLRALRAAGLSGVALSPMLERGMLGLVFPLAADGTAVIEGRPVRLRVSLPIRFPGEPPALQILDPGDLLTLPHVLEDGWVCVLEGDDLLLDPQRPMAVVQSWIARGVAIIGEGLRGENHSDHITEWEGRWSRAAGAMLLPGFVRPGSAYRRLFLHHDGKTGLGRVFDSADVLTAYHPERKPPTQRALKSAVLLPLQPDPDLQPPTPGASWGVADIHHRLLRFATDRDRAALLAQCRQAQTVELVVFSLPRPGAAPALFGVWFKGLTKRRHPLLHPDAPATPVPIVIDRRDPDFLIPRGGARQDLRDKRVLLIGCGAVGGHIAGELVRAGVGLLELMDPDVMMPGNTFRHALGNSSPGQGKAAALAARLRRDFPYVDVSGHAFDAQGNPLLQIAWVSFDAVVVATGNPTVDLALHSTIWNHGVPPKVVFTWLEAWGIGGHALAVRPGGDTGCLQCLYTDPETGQTCGSRAAFAEPGQDFLVDAAGCGARYSPFGSLDALRTAELATRLTVDLLTGDEPDRPLRSWRGDGARFEAAGLVTAPWYALSDAERHARRLGYKNPRCPLCG